MALPHANCNRRITITTAVLPDSLAAYGLAIASSQLSLHERHQQHPPVIHIVLTLAYLLVAAALMTAGELYPPPQSGVAAALLELSPYLLIAGLAPLLVTATTARGLMMGGGVILLFFLMQPLATAIGTVSNQQTELLALSVLIPVWLMGCRLISDRGWLSLRDGAICLGLGALTACWWWAIQDDGPAWIWLDEMLLVATVRDTYVLLPLVGYGTFTLALVLSLIHWNQSDKHKEFALHSAFILISLAALSLLPQQTIPLTATCSLLSILVFHTIQQVYGMAFTDELTNLPSRKALNDRLKSLGRHYAICMLDVDHFSKVNNKHGHDTGDEVLKTIAKYLSQVTEGGKAYRYGGEEFAIVFANREPNIAAEAVDEIRKAVSKYRFILRINKRDSVDPSDVGNRGKASTKNTLKVTFSAGIAKRASGEKPEEVMKRADELLYQAKEDGRNRVYYEQSA